MDVISFVLSAEQMLFLALAFVGLFTTTSYVLIMLEKNDPKTEKKRSTIPNLSVVVCAYNEEKTLAKCLTHLMYCDYPTEKIDFWVVDDGSNDRTPEIAKSFSRVRLVSGKHQGKAVAINQALRMVSGELVAIVDADTFVDRSALFEAALCFDSPNVGAVEGNVYVYEPHSIAQQLQSFEYYSMNYWGKANSLVNSMFVSFGQFSVFNRSIVMKLGGFDEKNLTEDMEMALRLQENHFELRHADNATVYTIVPETFQKLLKQRTRWYRGNLFNAFKYRHLLFNKKNPVLGYFSLPSNLFFSFMAVFLISRIALIVLGGIVASAWILFQNASNATQALSQIQSMVLSLGLFPWYSSIYLISLLFIVGYFYLGAKRANHSFKLNQLPAFALFFSLYFYLQGIAWLNAFRKELLGAEFNWETKTFS